ncbi:MAG: serine hydroxymethyltransferase [Planctomycetota bacterium]
MTPLERGDPEIFQLIRKELKRQHDHLELIASENFTSPAVLEAQASILTNKYAEGYPGARYYGGCEHVDEVERLAQSRAKALFGAEHANAQPHAGSQANMAAFLAMMEPGDTFLAMSLAMGGHITHGLAKNVSGKFFKPVGYGVDERSERLDYDVIAKLAAEHKPKLVVAGATAYPRLIDFARLAEIARHNDARLLVDMAHIAGLVAVGLHPSPVPHADVVTFTTHKTLRGPRAGMILCREAYAKAVDAAVFPGTQGGPLMHVIAAKAVALKEAATPAFRTYQERVIENARMLADEMARAGFRVVSGGTDNHLLLVDLRGEARSGGPSGKQAEDRLNRVHITVNKNLIPYDSRSPKETSGIRLGSAALTTRGMGSNTFRRIGNLIARALRSDATDKELDLVRAEVREVCEAHPLPYAT